MQAHIDRIACEHRPLAGRLHRLIRTAQPDAHPGISYGMLCYPAGARRLHLGAWKHGLSIYGWPQGQETDTSGLKWKVEGQRRAPVAAASTSAKPPGND